ncbi:hypothetical protein H0H81_009251 [Sphagnurus paluster]|uniref:Uncharacterized protein n=1 Tax=Sphagnurus paluster TaxID=117069 RepID=A0A9P7FPR5_9AGAR|nr:hypothetical protein H0H81_009251 [Sphagnurus paluster]
MHFLTSIVATITLAVPIFASPVLLHPIQKFDGEITGKYIVKLKNGIPLANVLGQLVGARITHSDWTIINAFAGELDDVSLALLRVSPDVEYIVQDGVRRAFATQTQRNAPWGLSRIDQSASLTNRNTNSLSFSYIYDDSAGRGVDIYIVDTGE